MTTEPLARATLEAITRGGYDDHLDRFISAAQERQRIVKREASLRLAPGATVRINEAISPRYFRGFRATVVSVNRTGTKPRALVQFDDADARYLGMSAARYMRNGNQINVPLACLDPITP